MALEGPRNLGCMGCTRPTTQPQSSAPLSGAVGGLLAASPFTMIIGFAFGAFIAWNYVLPKSTRGVSGHRGRRR
jgi:hypothetical protein